MVESIGGERSMRKSRVGESAIIGIAKEHEAPRLEQQLVLGVSGGIGILRLLRNWSLERAPDLLWSPVGRKRRIHVALGVQIAAALRGVRRGNLAMSLILALRSGNS